MTIGNIIESRSNALIVRLGKLSDKKYRDAERLFLAEGKKLTEEAITSGADIAYVLVASSKVNAFLPMLKALGTPEKIVYSVSDAAFGKVSTEQNPEGIIAVVRYMEGRDDPQAIASGERVILFESLRDPGNVGAVLRSAAALGIDRVVFSSDSADLYNPKTVRASMGALFRQKVTVVPHLAPVIASLRADGRRVLAAMLDEDALVLGREPLAGTDCVVIGNEGHGISAETAEACSGKLFIPMKPGAESLNASVAASLIMWELCGRGN